MPASDSLCATRPQSPELHHESLGFALAITSAKERPPMTVTVVLDMKLKTDSLDATLEGLRQGLPETRNFEGCQSLHVYQDEDDPSHLIIVEEWDRREDQQRYWAWQEERGAVEGMAEMLQRPPEITVAARRADIFSG
jgi:quinol monooxygenase YgiN